MKKPIFFQKEVFSIILIFSSISGLLICQEGSQTNVNPVLKTPLPQAVLTLLANEISGQIIYNNEIMLAGAPWQREAKEFKDTFYESRKIYELARNYGIETVKLIQYEKDGEFDYPVKGEFWILEPEKRLIARQEADTALIARGSNNVDLSSTLIYIPPLNNQTAKLWKETGSLEKYQDKIALMWSHPNRTTAEALDAAGVKGVISFNSQERYFDPDQVVYSRGSYSDWKNLKFGFSISWRQWSELLEDVEGGEKITVRCQVKLDSYPDRFESVFSWIPGTEPDKPGIIFTAHLFDSPSF